MDTVGFADHLVYSVSLLCLLIISTAGAFNHRPKCEEAGNVVRCHQNTLRCAGNQVCEAEVALGFVNCTGGGPFSRADTCHFCCQGLESCRRTLLIVQKGIDGASEVLHCPTCPRGTTDPQECLANLHPCPQGVKVCSVEWSMATVSAGCALHEIECGLHESNSQLACQEERLHEDAFCTRCCDSKECLLKALYITTTTTTTTTSTTTTTPTTTTMPMTTTTKTTTTMATTASTSPATSEGNTTSEVRPPWSPPTSLTTILASSSSSVPTTTPSLSSMTSSSSPKPDVTNTAAVVTLPRCLDNVKGDQCRRMQGVCEAAVGHLLCPHSCGFCDADPSAVLVG